MEPNAVGGRAAKSDDALSLYGKVHPVLRAGLVRAEYNLYWPHVSCALPQYAYVKANPNLHAGKRGRDQGR